MQLNREQIIDITPCPTCEAARGDSCVGVVRRNGNQRIRVALHQSRHDRANKLARQRSRQARAAARAASPAAVHSRTPQPDVAREAHVAPRFDPYVSPSRRRARARLAALDVVGFTEIAERLGVAPETPSTWRVRGDLPEPDLMLGICPGWLWVSVQEWAGRTGRLPDQKKATTSS